MIVADGRANTNCVWVGGRARVCFTYLKSDMLRSLPTDISAYAL